MTQRASLTDRRLKVRPTQRLHRPLTAACMARTNAIASAAAEQPTSVSNVKNAIESNNIECDSATDLFRQLPLTVILLA